MLMYNRYDKMIFVVMILDFLEEYRNGTKLTY
jgi:hypothetical protein